MMLNPYSSSIKKSVSDCSLLMPRMYLLLSSLVSEFIYFRRFDFHKLTVFLFSYHS